MTTIMATTHEETAEGVLSFDPHVWLDPENAKAMAAAVAAELAKADPANAATYTANAEAFARSLDALSAAIAAELAPVKDKPYVVFHDAYQYFEKRFGLAGGGLDRGCLGQGALRQAPARGARQDRGGEGRLRVPRAAV